MKVAGELQVDNFAASNGCICRLQYHVLVYKKLAGKLQICFENDLHTHQMYHSIFFFFVMLSGKWIIFTFLLFSRVSGVIAFHSCNSPVFICF